ncbi:MAG: helix-turn-helix domain-containing protein [Colwellia sp.]
MSDYIKINLDYLLLTRNMSLTELSAKTGISMANLSNLKRGKGKAIRFSTLLVICNVLACTPGDLISLGE